MNKFSIISLGLCALLLSACGINTPSKSLTLNDNPDPNFNDGLSRQGNYENDVLGHIQCEVEMGLYQARSKFPLPWLEKWGTAVTLTITAQDQSGVSPGLSVINPLQNFTKTFPVGGAVTSAQSFTMGLGGSASANATRSETIQVTWRNSDLLKGADDLVRNVRFTGKPPCVNDQKGVMIDGDLKLREFVYDKAQIAFSGAGNAVYNGKKDTHLWPIYNTMTEELIFLAAFGGSATPSWKLARVSSNPSTPLIAAQRTYTNDLIITMGTIAKEPTETQAAQLGAAAQSQHNAKVNASAIATSIQAQGH